MKKIDKYFVFYFVLISSIIGSFFVSDITRIFSMLFFFAYICLQEIIAYKERENVDKTYKKDVQKQIESLKNEINKINIQFFKLR